MGALFISMSEALDRISLSKTHLYRTINAGDFPRPVLLGPQNVAFLEREVVEWMEERLRAREQNEGVETQRERVIRSVDHTAYTNRLPGKKGHAQPPITPEYLDPKQAADLTSFMTKALERKRQRGEGPPHLKVGKSIRYAIADLRAWIEADRVHGEGVRHE